VGVDSGGIRVAPVGAVAWNEYGEAYTVAVVADEGVL